VPPIAVSDARLRVGHHAQHRALGIDDPRDVVEQRVAGFVISFGGA